MTKRLEYTKPHHLSTLHNQLVAAGYRPAPVEGEDPQRPGWLALTFPDAFADVAGVAAVVAAHDRAGAVAAWQAARDAETQEDGALPLRLADLDAAIVAWPAATTAQKLDGVLVLLRACRLILRLQLRRRGA